MNDAPAAAPQPLWAAATLVAILGIVVTLGAPPDLLGASLSTHFHGVHLGLELMTIVLAALVAVASFQSFDRERRPGGWLVITGFTVVAGSQFLHVLSYPELPAARGAAMDRSIFFAIVADSAAAVTIGVVVGSRLPGLRRDRAAALGVVLLAIVAWVGALHAERLIPALIGVRGTSLSWKTAWEIGLLVTHMAIAVLVASRARQDREPAFPWLALGSFMMGLALLPCLLHERPTPFQNLGAHLLGVVGYAVLYRSAFTAFIRSPFEDLRRSEARATEGEQRIRTLGDNLPHAVVAQLTEDESGRMRALHVGASVERVLGLKVSDVLATPGLLRSRVHPDDAPAYDAAVREALRTTTLLETTVRVLRTDGAVRHLHVVSQPRRQDDGRIVWDGVYADVTAQHEAELSRRELEQRLSASHKMESIGVLASGVAHDFNNVVGAILANVAMAREDAEHGHRAALLNSLAQIHQAGLHARQIVRQMLAFGRNHPDERRVLDLMPIVEESMALLRAALPRKAAIDACFEYAAGARAYAEVDATKLSQIVLNLVTNAAHALGPTGGHVEVGLRPCVFDEGRARSLGMKAGPYVNLWVRDDGCGMSDDTLRRLWEPFFTTKPEGQGTGLGLPMVLGVVREHGGVIEVDSAPGRGSCFNIYLPAAAAPDAAPPAAGADPATADAGGHVLYVDDDPVIALVVESLLTRAGYRVSVLHDPWLAEESAAAGLNVDIVISDQDMPHRSGLELLGRLRETHPRLPSVLLSGGVSAALAESARLAGIDAVVDKQRLLEDLAQVIARQLAAARAAAA